jgi:hypothetical protein
MEFINLSTRELLDQYAECDAFTRDTKFKVDAMVDEKFPTYKDSCKKKMALKATIFDRVMRGDDERGKMKQQKRDTQDQEEREGMQDETTTCKQQ